MYVIQKEYKTVIERESGREVRKKGGEKGIIRDSEAKRERWREGKRERRGK